MENETSEEYEEVQGDDGLWLPKNKGESIEGEVVEVRSGVYGKQVVIKDYQDKTFVTPSHKVLQTRISGVKVGDQLRIVYEGTELPKVKGWNGTRIYRTFKKKSVQEEVVN